MKALQLSLIITCLSFTNFSLSVDSVPQTASQKHACQWSAHLINTLNSQELQLAVNTLYLLHANALIDMKIRQFIIPITRLNQTIRSNIFNYKTTTQELAALRTLLDRLSLVIGARTIYNQMLEVCLSYCDNNNKGLLNETLAELQLFGQKSLNEYADERNTELAEKLKVSANILDDQVESLKAIANLHRGLAEGHFMDYFTSNESTKNMIALASLDELLKNNSIATQNAEYVLNTLDVTTEYGLKLIGTANEIYKEHYAALLTHLTLPECNQAYATTLFSMNGLLPQEYTSLLPHPDHVFEHVLETVKLYTQMEIIQ